MYATPGCGARLRLTGLEPAVGLRRGVMDGRPFPFHNLDVNNLPKVVIRQHGGRESNSRPSGCESNALTAMLPSHTNPNLTVNPLCLT